MSEDNNEVINIVVHARGGHGAVTACEIIAEAAYLSGKFVDVHAYPNFGAERRGAPIAAYAKLSKKEKIWDRAQITNPDIILVFDESVLNEQNTSALKKNGIIIVNSDKEPDYFLNKYNLSNSIKILVADINKLALEKNLTIDGVPVVNTTILGLLSRAVPELDLENFKKIIKNRMKPDIAGVNIELIEKGYDLAKTG